MTHVSDRDGEMKPQEALRISPIILEKDWKHQECRKQRHLVAGQIYSSHVYEQLSAQRRCFIH